ELGPALRGILAGNGNYIERVLGAHTDCESPLLAELRPIVRRSLARNVYRHYHGFASGQRSDFVSAEAATAKKVLYVLRTALTGAPLLSTGELVVDLTRHLDAYGYDRARELFEQKTRRERAVLSEADKHRWTGEVERAFALLEDARTSSPLPETPPNAA